MVTDHLVLGTPAPYAYDRVYVWDAAWPRIVQQPRGVDQDASLSRDGRYLNVGSYVKDLEAGTVTKLPSGLSLSGSVGISDDGRTAGFSSGATGPVVWQVQ